MTLPSDRGMAVSASALALRRCQGYATSPYPGEIPDTSYYVIEDVVHSFHGTDHERQIVDWLAEYRPVPILTYGSNACPGQLHNKVVVRGGHPAVTGVAVIPCWITGVRRVWSWQINSRQAVPHTLVSDPGNTIDGHVILLPERYLEIMDRTEGRAGSREGNGDFYPACQLAQVTATMPNGFVWSNPLTYLGIDRRGPLLLEGRAVSSEQISEDEAKQAINAGRGACGDQFLPAYERIRLEVPLSAIAHPEPEDFLLRQKPVNPPESR